MITLIRHLHKKVSFLNLDNASENLQAAESRIRDVDMAKEMMEFTRTNILVYVRQKNAISFHVQDQAVNRAL